MLVAVVGWRLSSPKIEFCLRDFLCNRLMVVVEQTASTLHRCSIGWCVASARPRELDHRSQGLIRETG